MHLLMTWRDDLLGEEVQSVAQHLLRLIILLKPLHIVNEARLDGLGQEVRRAFCPGGGHGEM